MEKLYSVISEALQKPLDCVTAEKKVFVDFQIESVEALELEFAIEEEFDLKIGEKDLWKMPSYLINNNYVKDGKLIEAAYKDIAKSFPAFSQDTLSLIKQPNDIYKYIRVVDIARYVSQKTLG